MEKIKIIKFDSINNVHVSLYSRACAFCEFSIICNYKVQMVHVFSHVVKRSIKLRRV